MAGHYRVACACDLTTCRTDHSSRRARTHCGSERAVARMMPPYCPDSAPPGERALFDVLASDPATTDWIVLHSLCIASHVRQVQGEADFVVIVPGHGIVVVEVKSHLSVDRLADGRRTLGSHPPTPPRPSQQASAPRPCIRAY